MYNENYFKKKKVNESIDEGEDKLTAPNRYNESVINWVKLHNIWEVLL